MEKQQADRIITEYLPKIYGYAMKKSFSYDEAEDLCSDIVQEAYFSLLRTDKIYNLSGYIWRLSEHCYAKYVSLKKKQAGISIDGMEIPYYEDFLPDDAGEEAMRLRREIAFLTEKRRRIVYLFYYENKNIADIAQTLKLPEGTVKWHLNQARNELKEGFSMERKIGKLGLNPVTATRGFGHSGCPGNNSGPEFYLGDKINLNIVYSVYETPRTREEIAEELGMTLVYIEDKIAFLEENGFLVPVSGGRYTTYVNFPPRTYSLELLDNIYKVKAEIAQILAAEYAPIVLTAVANLDRVYIPGGNYELLEAAAVFYGITNKGSTLINKDLSKYYIKTTAGGDFIASVHLESVPEDPEYQTSFDPKLIWSTGNMIRESSKYPGITSWASDSKFCSREGGWMNNLYTDYDYLYEFLKGDLSDTPANAEKRTRLQNRQFLSGNDQINIMIVNSAQKDFFDKIPAIPEQISKKFAAKALEYAMLKAKKYPSQMQDLIISWSANFLISQDTAVMVLDILYENGTFKPLTERERITSNLIMFSDLLPTV